MVGPFGLGKRKERGKMLINLQATWFGSDEYVVQEKENEAVHMEDYILVKQRVCLSIFHRQYNVPGSNDSQ